MTTDLGEKVCLRVCGEVMRLKREENAEYVFFNGITKAKT